MEGTGKRFYFQTSASPARHKNKSQSHLCPNHSAYVFTKNTDINTKTINFLLVNPPVVVRDCLSAGVDRKRKKK